MMIIAALVLLLFGAALALALGRRISTRLLGNLSAGLTAAATGLLAFGPWDAAGDLHLILLQLDAISYRIVLNPAAAERALAVGVLGGSTGALVLLSVAIAPTIREFGAIFGWALLALAATLLSLVTPLDSILLPLSWAVAVISSYSSLRASGALNQDERAPQSLILGLLGVLLLFGAQPGTITALNAGELPPWPAALAILGAVYAVGGVPPLSNARSEVLHTPAPLGVLLYAMFQPTLALGTLFRIVVELPILPASWSVVGVTLGALGTLGAAAGAVRGRQLREVLAWIGSAQVAMIATALLLGDGLVLAGAHILLVSLIMSMLAGAAAVSVLERSSGSDDYSSELPGPLLRTAGALWLISGAAALGLPPFFGFWGRRWLLEGLRDLAPWALPALPAAGVLLLVAIIVPIGRFWAPPQADRAVATPRRAPQTVAILALVLLALLGAAPQLAWDHWLSAIPLAPAVPPIEPRNAALIAGLGLVFGVMVLMVARLPSARNTTPERDETVVRLGPDGLSAALGPLALLGRAGAPLRLIWAALEQSSLWLRTALTVFEQRYYLFGVIMVLVALMLLMAQ